MSLALLRRREYGALHFLLQYPPSLARCNLVYLLCVIALLLCVALETPRPFFGRVLVASPLVSLSPRSLTPDCSPALLALGLPSPFDPPRPRLPWLARWPGAPRAERDQGCNRDAGLWLCTEPAICGYVSLTRHFLRLLPLTHRPFGCIARPAVAVAGGKAARMLC